MASAEPITDDHKDNDWDPNHNHNNKDKNNNNNSNNNNVETPSVTGILSMAETLAGEDAECIAAAMAAGGGDEEAAEPEVGFIVLMARCASGDGSDLMSAHRAADDPQHSSLTDYYKGYGALPPNGAFPPPGYEEWAEANKGRYAAAFIVSGDKKAQVCIHWLVLVGTGWFYSVHPGTRHVGVALSDTMY